MTGTAVVWALIVVMLAAAALMAVARLALGPSILDRAISLDVVVAVSIAGVGAFVAFHRDPGPLPILLVLSLVGFIGSVSVARFVARRANGEAAGHDHG